MKKKRKEIGKKENRNRMTIVTTIIVTIAVTVTETVTTVMASAI